MDYLFVAEEMQGCSKLFERKKEKKSEKSSGNGKGCERLAD
jgi:hypothetical protein